MNRTYREVLDVAARPYVPDELDLFPRIAARLERRTLMQTLRARPALAILIVLVALSLLSGIAYAIGRSLGYIPGVGLVEQGAEIRVLAEPVSLTREGITLTVEQAYLTPERTVLIFSVDGIPRAARPKGEGGFACHPSTPSLRLSNGTAITITSGEGTGWETGYRNTMIYPPIPSTDQTAAFLLPCLQDVAPAAAPQNWELTLRFSPAPPDLTVIPVMEIATSVPTPTAPPAVSLASSDTFMGLSYHLEAMKATGRGYLIETSIRWEEGLYADFGVGTGAEISLIDANGQKIPLSRVEDARYQMPVEPRRGLLGYSLSDAPFTPPLTLTLAWVGANLPLETRPQFTFDPGADPQPGQEWAINQTIEILGEPVEILTARYVTHQDLQDREWMRFMPEDLYGFEFTLSAGPEFRSISTTVASGFSPDGSGTGGQPTERDENGIIKSYALMNGKMIAPLVISIGYVDISHSWQITFDPPVSPVEMPIASESSPDISIQIEKVIPIDDGYYLVGRTNWNDPRLSNVGLGGWDAKLMDENGNEYPIEPASFDEIGITDVQPGQWAYKAYGKALPASLTLKMTRAGVQFLQPYTFPFEPGPTMDLGQEWQINQPLEILGYQATVLSAQFMQQGDLRGFEFSLTADPELQSIPLIIESGITGGYSSGGGASPRDENGIMKAHFLSDGQFGSSLLVTVRSAVLLGDWQTTWNPLQAEAGTTPFSVPKACVTLDQWKQALGSPGVILSGLPGKVLIMRGALAPDPSLFLSSLDGSSEWGLVFGHGSLSPDGTELAYSDENNQLFILDIASGGKTSLGNGFSPVWSPEGNQIAFLRETEKGTNIFVLDANGGASRPLTNTTEFFNLAGWNADGTQLLIESGNKIEMLNVADGSRYSLLVTNFDFYNSPRPAISPDGQWLAYLEQVPGRRTPGIYLARLDGSETRLLVQLDDWTATVALFSPDSKWLAINLRNPEIPNATITPALVNVDTCQVVPLPNLNGEIRGWVK